MEHFPFNNYLANHNNHGIPPESKLANYTSVRGPFTTNNSALDSSTNNLTHTLASLNLDGSTSTHSNSNNIGTTGLFQKSYSALQNDNANVSPPQLNGSPEESRGHTPVPPMAYQPHVWVEQENVGGTTYYYQDELHQQELQEDPGGPHLYPNYSVYSGPPSHLKDYTTRLITGPPPSNPIVHPNPQQNSIFAPEEIKQEIVHKNAATLSQPNRQVFPDLPAQVDHYTEICPLEPTAQKVSLIFGYPTSVYKAINSRNGFTYCLHRIHGFRLPSGKWLSEIEKWKRICHSNLVSVREIFTSKAFGDSSLIFVYDYFPASETLMTRYFDRNNQVNGYVDPFSTGDPAVPRPYSHQKNALLRHQAVNMLPENLLWAYIVQLSSAIRTVHGNGLAIRCLDPTKILVTSRTRPHLRINCCGIHDLVSFDANSNQASVNQYYQQEDLVGLGNLIMALACNSILAVRVENMDTSMELISRHYSPEMKNLIEYLKTFKPGKTINEIMPSIGARFYHQIDSANARVEFLEHALAKEIENGRLFRLIVKLNTIVERQELNMDPSWSETGDRYLLKLFRDYVFHQVDHQGRPWIDFSHIVYCLNRLDAGITEKVCLMSRDEQSILITTYAELKQCMETSFNDILTLSQAPVQYYKKGSLFGMVLHGEPRKHTDNYY